MQEMKSNLSDLSILAVFAHPDDEGFGCGWTRAMLAARGAKITLVCATNGDAGEISDPELATRETLAQVRRDELRLAMDITGVHDIRFLGYRDSGMAGTEDNNHPDALFQADADHVIDQLVAVLGKPRKITPFPRHDAAIDDGLADNTLAVFEFEHASATVASSAMEVDGFARRQFVVLGDEGVFDLRPIEPPGLRLAFSKARGQYQKGYQTVPLPDRPRYAADAVDFAKCIRGEKDPDYSTAHDLAVPEAVLRASGRPLDTWPAIVSNTAPVPGGMAGGMESDDHEVGHLQRAVARRADRADLRPRCRDRF